MEQYLRIGVISSTHGIKGEVKVFVTTDSPGRFKEVEDVVIRSGKGDIETKVEGARFYKNMAIVKFACFATPEEAAKYRSCDIMIHRKDAQPLEEGEYYIADLLGCRVFVDEESRELLKTGSADVMLSDDGCIGQIKDVLQTGANDVYIVKNGKKKLLIPVIKDCILDVNIEEETVLVHLLPGLI